MTAADVLLELQSLGTEQNRKIYRRHGVGGAQYGVSVANLKKVQKRLKVNHDLAVELWASGNHDARVLATMIADRARMTGPALEAWAADLDSYVLADAFVGLAARTSSAKAKAEKWMKARGEWIGAAGWNMLALLALEDASLPDDYFAERLTVIERDIHTRPNRVRYAMNGALIAIGGRNETLKAKALATAAKVGKVEVDHGETGCQTPDAAEYIEKIAARRG